VRQWATVPDHRFSLRVFLQRLPVEWPGRESNPRHADFQSGSLAVRTRSIEAKRAARTSACCTGVPRPLPRPEPSLHLPRHPAIQSQHAPGNGAEHRYSLPLFRVRVGVGLHTAELILSSRPDGTVLGRGTRYSGTRRSSSDGHWLEVGGCQPPAVRQPSGPDAARRAHAPDRHETARLEHYVYAPAAVPPSNSAAEEASRMCAPMAEAATPPPDRPHISRGRSSSSTAAACGGRAR
jgi:hypothetical protein